MISLLSEMRPVRVVGVGMHRFQFASDTPYIRMGLTALRAALADAGLAWHDVDMAFVGNTGIGLAAGRVMFDRMGSTGLAVTQVENASASGASAFQLACTAIASGRAEVALAIGVDKHGGQQRASAKAGIPRLSDTANVPLVKYALMAERLSREMGLAPEDLAAVAVKNHGAGAQNPFAQFQKPRTMEQVLAATPVAGMLTSLQCCPRGEGAAAAILVSDEAVRRLGLAEDRTVRVASSVLRSERPPMGREIPSVTLAREVADLCLKRAGLRPADLDVVELHDAFSIEEILYTEAFGLCSDGAAWLREGCSAIGGDCAVSPSGGLLAQGHPLGPTGLGQVHEIVRQLRGEQGPRQQPGAKAGMAHLIGLGSIAIAHALVKE